MDSSETVTGNAADAERKINVDDKHAEPKDLSVFVPEVTRKPGEFGFAVLGIIFGALGYYFALDMTSDSYSAPSVFPKLTSTLIMLCGITVFIKDSKKARPEQGSPGVWHYLMPKDVLVMMIGLIIYCIVLPRLHFIVSSYIFMVSGMVYLHRGKKILQSLIISAGALAVLVAIFRYIFMVILP